MTDTNTTTSATDPADTLLNLIAIFLAPMFLSVSGGDISLARAAAIETVAAYRATNQADLISIAQIIGFGLAALGSLSLSMADDISVSLTLRLRGNANALNRSAEQNRRALKESRHDNEPPRLEHPARPENPPPPVQMPAPQQPPASPTPEEERLHQRMWAKAMANVAAEVTASLPGLPPGERKVASIRAAALNSTANELLAGITEPKLQPGALNGLIRPSPA